MRCDFCHEGELENIKNPHTFDFSRDGHLFKVCNDCSSCDNMDLREERKQEKMKIKAESRYSFNDKKKVIRIICTKKEINGELKKEITNELLPEIKWVPDESCYRKIADFFKETQSKIEYIFSEIVREKIYGRPVDGKRGIVE